MTGTAQLIEGLVEPQPAALMRGQLIDQVRTYRQTVFGRDVQHTVWKPLINQIEALLVNLGVPSAVSEIATVRQQLRLAESLRATSVPGCLTPMGSISSTMTPANACTPATPRAFRRVHRIRSTSRYTACPSGTTMTNRIYGRSTSLEVGSRSPTRHSVACFMPATR